MRLPDDAPRDFRAPMGATPQPAGSLRHVYRRGGAFYLTPRRTVVHRGPAVGRMSGEMIQGCGETYEPLVGRNDQGQPLNEPCRGMLGTQVYCDNSDLESWHRKLVELGAVVRARQDVARPMIAALNMQGAGNDAAKAAILRAGQWLALIQEAPSADYWGTSNTGVGEVTALIRAGTCHAETLDGAIVSLKTQGIIPHAPVPPPPPGTTKPAGLLGFDFNPAWLLAGGAALLLLSRK